MTDLERVSNGARDLLVSPRQNANGGWGAVVIADQLRLVASDVQDQIGPGWPWTEIASRQCGQSEDRVHSAPGQDVRIIRDHFLLHRGNEQLLFCAGAVSWRLVPTEPPVAPGQCLRGERELAFDLQKQQSLELFLRRGRKG